MLFKIDYVKRSDGIKHSQMIDFVADRTEAVKRFMNGFFEANPGDAVKIETITCIEVVGEVSRLDDLLRGA